MFYAGHLNFIVRYVLVRLWTFCVRGAPKVCRHRKLTINIMIMTYFICKHIFLSIPFNVIILVKCVRRLLISNYKSDLPCDWLWAAFRSPAHNEQNVANCKKKQHIQTTAVYTRAGNKHYRYRQYQVRIGTHIFFLLAKHADNNMN